MKDEKNKQMMMYFFIRMKICSKLARQFAPEMMTFDDWQIYE